MHQVIFDVIKGRHSVRAYLDKPVPNELLEEVLNAALQSPSWGNTQPWEFAVAGGPVLEQIKNEYLKAADEGRPPSPDFAFPVSWPDENKKRYFDNGQRLYQTLGIEREDKKAREELRRKGNEFFGAPNVIFLFLDEGLSHWSLFDLGLFSQSLMLVAHSVGLGTCPMAFATIYPDIVREALEIPQNKKLALGIPIGFPDETATVNQHLSARVSLEEAALKWYK